MAEMRLLTETFRTNVKSTPEVRQTLERLIQKLQRMVISGIEEDPTISSLPLSTIADTDFEGLNQADVNKLFANKYNILVVFINHLFEKDGGGGA